jgi:hypothetical protein
MKCLVVNVSRQAHNKVNGFLNSVDFLGKGDASCLTIYLLVVGRSMFYTAFYVP